MASIAVHCDAGGHASRLKCIYADKAAWSGSYVARESVAAQERPGFGARRVFLPPVWPPPRLIVFCLPRCMRCTAAPTLSSPLLSVSLSLCTGGLSARTRTHSDHWRACNRLVSSVWPRRRLVAHARRRPLLRAYDRRTAATGPSPRNDATDATDRPCTCLSVSSPHGPWCHGPRRQREPPSNFHGIYARVIPLKSDRRKIHEISTMSCGDYFSGFAEKSPRNFIDVLLGKL